MNLYEEYQRKMRRIADINHAVAVLHWDNEVNLPKGGSHFRSQQIATLTAWAHTLFTEEGTGVLLERLLQSKIPDRRKLRNVELTLRDYRKEVSLPTDFVERMAMVQSEAFSAWIKARDANDFAVFAPALEEVVTLKQQEAEYRGFEHERYDALLDVYEPGLTAASLDHTFTQAREQIIPMIHDILAAQRVDRTFLNLHFPKDKQWEYGLDLLRQLGYDFDHGRQDISAHPFTISFSPEDVRVTTRIDEDDFSNMLWSCIHECGHALYEQGLPVEQYGLPLGSAASLAIHESQSRMWENQVGRGKAFWQHQLPLLKKFFPEQLGNVNAEHFHAAINAISPNLIRTEADELHYHLHVMIRYEMERTLINTGLPIDQLPELWNRKYKDYLGVDVPDDRKGILQDVHWSHGGFGYFPTYSLGSFYAAQLYDQATRDIPDLEVHLAQGQYTALHRWLQENIYQYGREYDPGDLCEKVSGAPLDIGFFVKYAAGKYEIPVRSTNSSLQVTNSSP